MSGKAAKRARREAENRELGLLGAGARNNEDKQGWFGALLREKALAVALAAGLVAGGSVLCHKANSLHAVPDEFYRWDRHRGIGLRISEHNPDLVSNALKEAEMYQMGDAGVKQWPAYADFTKKDLLDVMSQNRECAKVAANACGYIKSAGRDVATDQKGIEKSSFSLALELLNDQGYNKNIIAATDIDCKAISVTYLAAYVAEASHVGKRIEVELDTGVAFSKALVGDKGIGHQWIRVGGNIIDPSIRPELGFRVNPPELSYVPIVGLKFEVYGNSVLGKTTIYCYPKDMETEYSGGSGGNIWAALGAGAVTLIGVIALVARGFRRDGEDPD